MRNQSFITLSMALFVVMGCKRTSWQGKIYSTLSGKIENNTAKNLVLKGHSRHLPNWKKMIKINADGTFKDTLKLVHLEDSKKTITDIIYTFSLDEKPFGIIFLENGQDLQMNINTKKEYGKNVTFKGSGAPNNNYYKDKRALLQKVFGNALVDSSYFVKKGNEKEQLKNLKKELKALLEKYNISKLIYEEEKIKNERTISIFLKYPCISIEIF